MKSCLGLLFSLILFVLVIGGGGLIWYLSETSEFFASFRRPCGQSGASAGGQSGETAGTSLNHRDGQGAFTAPFSYLS